MRRLLVAFLLAISAAAQAFQGPYASLVAGPGGFQLDLDIRWPDGPPPAGGWPAVFFAHGSGGDKNSFASLAETYADDGYVALTWTGRLVTSQPTPTILAGDVVALKNWVVNDFQNESGFTVPTDPARFGLNGASLGGYTSWSGGLMSNAFATIVPFNWAFHFFQNGLTLNGSIDRRTAGPLAAQLPDDYDAAGLQTLADAVFGSALGAFPNVTIPVMSQVAFLDARTGSTYAMQDYLALTSAPRFLYLGSGGHGTPNNDGTFRSQLRERWFAHYLKGEANGIDTEPPIQLALVGTNERMNFTSWPPADTRTATVWLRDGDALAPTPPLGVETPDTIVNDPVDGYGWDQAAPTFPPNQMRNNLPKSLVIWETPPLTDEVLMIGQPHVRLEVAGTGSRFQVNVHLYDVVDGDEPLLLAWTTATVPMVTTLIDVDMSLTARRVPAGHRLRLEVTNRMDEDLDYENGSDPESDIIRYIPFFELSTTQVFHDAARPSSLTVPLIGADDVPLPGVTCDPAPRAGCRLPGEAGKSPLTVKNLTPDTKDQVKWKWSKGVATTFAELANPLDGAGYVFCLYDGTAGTLLLQSRSPAGGVCATKPCWKQLGSPTNPKGYKYTDKDLTPDGLKKVQVQAGEPLKAKAVVSGKGENLAAGGLFPTLPLPTPLTAQLQTTNGCFEVTYPTALVNDGLVFKAK